MGDSGRGRARGRGIRGKVRWTRPLSRVGRPRGTKISEFPDDLTQPLSHPCEPACVDPILEPEPNNEPIPSRQPETDTLDTLPSPVRELAADSVPTGIVQICMVLYFNCCVLLIQPIRLLMLSLLLCYV